MSDCMGRGKALGPRTRLDSVTVLGIFTWRGCTWY